MHVETLDEKRIRVLTYVAQGLDPEQACILAEVKEADMEDVLDDDSMRELIRYENAKRELELLELHRVGTRKAISQGNTNSVQWALKILNGRKYGDKVSVDLPAQRRTANSPTDMENLSDAELLRIVGRA